MPQFVRKRRGWDWFTPKTLRHLPPDVRERITKGAAKSAHQRSRLLRLAVLAGMSVAAAGQFWLAGKIRSRNATQFLFEALLAFQGLILLGMVGVGLWYRRLFHGAIRDELWNAGIRPAACFDCGYYTEGFDGDECPSCGAALVAPKPVPPAQTN
jgi:hypothetical protein